METEGIARIALLGFLGGAGAALLAWAAGLVFHGLGRRTSLTWRVFQIAAGCSMGAGAAGLLRLAAEGPLAGTDSAGLVLVTIASIVLPLLVVVTADAGYGHRTAGVILLGISVAWLGVWLLTGFVNQFEGSPLPPVSLLIGAGFLVAGALDVREPDRLKPGRPDAAVGRPGSRRAGMLLAGFVREARYGILGPGVILGLVSVTLAGQIPRGGLLLTLALGLAGAVAGTEIELRWIPPRIRAASEASNWVGYAILGRAREGAVVPIFRTERAVREWLAATPETDGSRWPRISLLTAARRFEDARAELERMPRSTPQEQFRYAALAGDIAWRNGGEKDVALLRDLASRVGAPGSAERLLAEGEVEMEAASERLAAMDPEWFAGLAAFRPRLGSQANGLHVRQYRGATYTLALLVYGCAALMVAAS